MRMINEKHRMDFSTYKYSYQKCWNPHKLMKTFNFHSAVTSHPAPITSYTIFPRTFRFSIPSENTHTHTQPRVNQNPRKQFSFAAAKKLFSPIAHDKVETNKKISHRL